MSDTLISSYDISHDSGYGFTVYTGSTSRQNRWGQAFSVSSPYRVTSLKLALNKTGSPQGAVVARLRGSFQSGAFYYDNNTTGALSTPIQATTLPVGSTPSLIEFFFPAATDTYLVPGIVYTISLEFQGGDSSNYVDLSTGRDTLPPYNEYWWFDDALSVSSSEALIYYLYGLAETDPHNRYWINGTGNWSDATHWSLTSGIPASQTISVYDESHYTGSGIMCYSTGDGVGVVVSSPTTMKVTKCKFYLRRKGAATGNIYAHFAQAVGTGNAKTSIGSTFDVVSDPVDITTIPSNLAGVSPGLIEFTFPDNANMVMNPGSFYTIRVTYEAGTATTLGLIVSTGSTATLPLYNAFNYFNYSSFVSTTQFPIYYLTGYLTAPVPISTENSLFDANSGSGIVTVNTDANCKDIDCTGYTGTLAGSTYLLNVYGSLKFVAGMTYSRTGTTYFKSTTAGKTIDLGGKTLGTVSFDGMGGYWTQTSAFRSSSLTLTQGTLDTGNQNLTLSSSFYSTNLNVRSIILGSSTLTCGLWSVNSSLSLSPGTSTIIVTAGGTGFSGGGLTYNNVSLTVSDASVSVSGANTFLNLSRTAATGKTSAISFSADQIITGALTLNGSSTINRLLVLSSVIGTSRTLTAENVSCANVDFQDITGSGNADWDLSAISGGSGDCGGNSDIIFTTPVEQHWINVDGGNWSLNTNWTSRIPLPQDNVYLNCAFGTSKTVTIDMLRLGKNIDWTGATWVTSLTFAFSVPVISCSLYGNLILVSNLSITNNGSIFLMSGRENTTITSNGCRMSKLGLNNYNSTISLNDDLICDGGLVQYNGTFDATMYNVTTSNVSFSLNVYPRTLKLGTGTWIITGRDTLNYGWRTSSVTTVVPGTSLIKMTDTSNNPLIFEGGNKLYNNIWFSRGASTGTITISGTNTFNDIKDDGTESHTIIFPNGVTTVSSLSVVGNPGKLIYMLRTGGTGSFTLSDTTGTNNISYVYLQNSTATGGALWKAYDGTNVDGGGNVGWDFDPPARGIDTIEISENCSVQIMNLPDINIIDNINLIDYITTKEDRFWVGGSGDWNDSNHWASSSGGTPGATIPKSVSNVFFDINSSLSGAIVSLPVNGICRDFKSTTGVSYSFVSVGSYLYIYGDTILESGTTFPNTDPGHPILTGASSKTFTSNNASIYKIEQTGGTTTLLDNLTLSGQLYLWNGTFRANDKNITANDFFIGSFGEYFPTIYMGSGTWEATGGSFYCEEGILPVVIYSETSTIKLSSSNFPIFYTTNDGHVFHDLWITGNYVRLLSSNTFNTIKVEPGLMVLFPGTGTTQTLNDFIAVGTSLNLITLLIYDEGPTKFTLSKSSGTILCDYLELNGSNASGGATWYAGPNSIDSGNNSGWIFSFVGVDKTDSINITESVSVSIPYLGDVSKDETLNVSEQLSMYSYSGTLLVSVYETINISSDETIRFEVPFTMFIHDDIEVSDSTQALASLSDIIVNSQVNISEYKVFTGILYARSSDSINIYESLSFTGRLGNIYTYSDITISENIKDAVISNTTVNDSIVSTEYVKTQLRSYISENQMISISEYIDLELFFNISTSDTLNMTENKVMESFRFAPSPANSRPLAQNGWTS